MKKFKQHFLLLILFIGLLFLSSPFCFAQEKPSYYKNKTTIKLGYKPIVIGYSFFDEKKLYAHSFGIEGSYGVTKWLDVGGFVEYYHSKMQATNVDMVTETYHHNHFNYGISSNIHILPMFINPQFCIVDVYLSPKIGISTLRYSKNIMNLDYMKDVLEPGKYSLHGFYYDISAGVAFNFHRNVGIFGEANYTRSNKFGYKVGVNIRF